MRSGSRESRLHLCVAGTGVRATGESIVREGPRNALQDCALSGVHRKGERGRQRTGWRACSSTQTHLHFARDARQPKQGHMGSTRTSAEWGRVDGLRARCEVEQGLLEDLAKEAPALVLLPNLVVGVGLRLASIALGLRGWTAGLFWPRMPEPILIARLRKRTTSRKEMTHPGPCQRLSRG